MKHLIILLSFSFFNCASQQKVMKNNYKIEYKAQTRGALYEILVKDNLLSFKSYNDSKTIVLTKEQVRQLTNEINNINLKAINDLEAPTTKRFTDGVMIAYFKINKAENSYKSSEFDHEYPPKELKQLFNILISYLN
jgi:hypothetical protein